MDDRVGCGVGELAGGGGDVGLGGVFVGAGKGVLVGTIVGTIVGIIVGGSWVGSVVFVAFCPGVAVGVFVLVATGGGFVQDGVSVGFRVGKLVELAEGRGMDVAVDPGLSVAVGFTGTSVVGVNPEGNDPKTVEVGVGVNGIITAISGDLPVSGGLLIPSKSLMMSKPIAGTECIISSTE